MSTRNSKLRKSIDIAIVGGGVIGLSIARALAHPGVSEIVLCDKGELGKEASWAAGGIIGPQVEADCADDFFKLACASRDLYPEFAQALHEETGTDVELDTTGTLYVAFTEDEEAELRQRYEWQWDAGFRIEWLNAKDVRSLEPDISNQVRCALRFPDDWQVENRKLVDALIASSRKFGVKLLPNCEITSLCCDHNRVVGVNTANGIISASAVVLCAGAWTSSITTPAAASAHVQVEPGRGQMLCFKPAQPIARHVMYSKRGYLVPRRDGRLLAGSTSEHVGFDKRVTDEGVSSIKSMAFEIAPGLRGTPQVDSWAGFRPRALDELPVIGPDEEIEGLFYATGHFRNGILLAPVTAEIVGNVILDEVSPTVLQTFLPNRFSAIHTLS